MAQKKKQTIKRSAFKSGLTKWLGRDSKVLLFVLLFALVGIGLLIRSFAQSDYPTDPESIVAAYISEVPSVATRNPATGKVTYLAYSASYIVLGDGSLQCDNGNTSGAVTVGQLSQTSLKKLHSELVNLDLATVPPQSGPAGQTSYVNKFESYLLAAKGNTDGFAVYKGGAKSAKLIQMQTKLLQACQQATTTVIRGKTRHVKVPKLSAIKNASVIARIGAVLSPKAAAFPAANGAMIDAVTADDQFNRINQARANNGKPAYTRQGCLNDWAYAQAQAMANSGSIYHSADLTVSISKYCSSNWTRVGENVGKGASSSAVFDAFMASPTHKSNILGVSRYAGTGAYKAPNGTIFIAQEFGTW